MESGDFKRCEAFHGHVCGGLAIGYLAATAGWRGANRWSDPAGDFALHLLVQADSEQDRSDP